MKCFNFFGKSQINPIQVKTTNPLTQISQKAEQDRVLEQQEKYNLKVKEIAQKVINVLIDNRFKENLDSKAQNNEIEWVLDDKHLFESARRTHLFNNEPFTTFWNSFIPNINRRNTIKEEFEANSSFYDDVLKIALDNPQVKVVMSNYEHVRIETIKEPIHKSSDEYKEYYQKTVGIKLNWSEPKQELTSCFSIC